MSFTKYTDNAYVMCQTRFAQHYSLWRSLVIQRNDVGIFCMQSTNQNYHKCAENRIFRRATAIINQLTY